MVISSSQANQRKYLVLMLKVIVVKCKASLKRQRVEQMLAFLVNIGARLSSIHIKVYFEKSGLNSHVCHRYDKDSDPPPKFHKLVLT